MSRHRLGTELKRLRLSRSLRIEDVAARLEVAPSTLSRIETGKAPTRASYLTTMLDIYGIGDPQQRIWLTELAQEGKRNGWWAYYEPILPVGLGDYLDLEAAAIDIHCFSVLTVPELLQTPEYAAAVYQATRPGLTADQVRALVMLQRRRQSLVLSSGRHRLDLIIDQSVLLRSIGSARVMADQLDYLRTAVARAFVTLRVLKLDTDQPVLSPPFTVLTFAEHDNLGIACYEGRHGRVSLTWEESHVRAMKDTFIMLAKAAVPFVAKS